MRDKRTGKIPIPYMNKRAQIGIRLGLDILHVWIELPQQDMRNFDSGYLGQNRRILASFENVVPCHVEPNGVRPSVIHQANHAPENPVIAGTAIPCHESSYAAHNVFHTADETAF